jgi:hypothetical protein
MRDNDSISAPYENYIRERNNRGTSLPPSVRRDFEHAFATDFSSVRIFVSHAATLAGAESFASGNDIHFAPGRYNPYSENGRETIGHELAHVVQQAGGRVAVQSEQAINDALAAPGSQAMGDGSV